LSDEKKSFWTNPRYSLLRVIIFVAVLSLLTEVGVRVYFSRPGIIERNPGNTTASMAYLFEQMAKPADPKVVFIGSSVVQGYGNCLPGTHFPALIEKKLRKTNRFRNARVFNMSSAGNRYGDHLATLVESLKYKPDLVVTAVHIKMFSRHSSLVKPFTRDEALYYFRDEPEFWHGGRNDMFRRFHVPASRYRQIWLDNQVQKISALYRYRRLIGNLAFDDYHFPAAMLAEKAQAALGLMDWEMIVAYNTTQEERNDPYLWRLIPKHVVVLQYMHCDSFDFTDENINWITFKNFCEYAQKKGVKVLFFLNPINYDFVNEPPKIDERYLRDGKMRPLFDWDLVIPEFRRRTIQVIKQYGHDYVDLTHDPYPNRRTDGLDLIGEWFDFPYLKQLHVDPQPYELAAYFSDLDHLNMTGHDMIAERLFVPIVRLLQRN